MLSCAGISSSQSRSPAIKLEGMLFEAGGMGGGHTCVEERQDFVVSDRKLKVGWYGCKQKP